MQGSDYRDIKKYVCIILADMTWREECPWLKRKQKDVLEYSKYKEKKETILRRRL